MKVAIVGLKGSGKTTIFNSLTGLAAKTGGYSSQQDINLGLIKVPDERLEVLSRVFEPKKTTPAEITFADIAMPAEEEKFSAKVLEKLKVMDALVLVIKGFDDGKGDFHPLEDVAGLESELLFSDFAIVDKSLASLRKERRDQKLIQTMDKVHACLDAEKPLRLLDLDEAERKQIAGFAFLSIKPTMVVINIPESGFASDLYASIQEYCQAHGLRLMQIAGSLEEEISHLSPTEQADFLREMGLSESARDKFIRESYDMMNLISFLTVGKDEVRSWTIPRGTTAVKAAGKIHSDIERGFIRAEVVSYEDFINCHSNMAEVKKRGLMRLEGKDYVVKDGDIINFRFNI
ncbi:MAG: YchF family ATPase [bacterium]|nr:YchF family ATPase [bacterium]